MRVILYYNISIVKEKLPDIIKVDGWYYLIIPGNQLEINSPERLDAATDYAVMILKSYMDKFYRYEKERWEAPYLEYTELTANNNNFVGEYKITYASQGDSDQAAARIESLITNSADLLAENKGLGEYEKSEFCNRFVLLDYQNHLYTPLVCTQNSDPRLQISPVSLNEGEKKFIDYLKEYTDNHAGEWNDKSLYILRNKSKSGIGFFEAGNFYPDFILWIDTPEIQYISFIDPKGLMHIMPDNQKIAFHKKIKELEARLAPTAGDKKIVLNSFIMSVTPYYKLKQLWETTTDVEITQAWLQERNVYTLDNSECVELMIEKILQQPDITA